ncbi:hypothetical protein SuNHUV7_32980 (plasmid) [Pseudoseohaeicola sp. NH-UV-7]
MKRTFQALTLAAALTVFGPTARAQYYDNYEKGLAAYNSDDYATALEELRPLAEDGVPVPQYYLALMYDFGNGVAENDAVAVKWYRLAAEQGYAEAQHNLGVMYDDGDGVIENDIFAYMWWNIAASLGIEDAKKNRDKVADEMTREEIAKAQALAAECVTKNYKGC